MRLLSKSLILLLIISFAISGLSLSIKPTTAQSIPKPSVPEFSVKFFPASASFNITDPITGFNNTVNFDNSTIQVMIINQPFNPYKDANGNSINLYYNVSQKGPYGNWNYHPTSAQKYIASNSEFTVLTFLTNDMNQLQQNSTGVHAEVIPTPVGELDFQVQALIGYYSIADVSSGSSFLHQIEVFTGESSDWSPTQTITIGEASTSDTPNSTTSSSTTPSTPTSSPIAPDTNSDSTDLITLPFTTFIVLTAVLAAIIVTLTVLFFRTHRKTAKIK
jgi:hypothetical protein